MANVSVIIPARNEIYLEKTVRNVLENARGEIEVIVVLDGWIPDPPIDFKDERVKVFHFEKAVGHRAATNHGARQALGKFIMKLDAHCAVGEGFDVILAKDCEYDWTVIPRMWNLDVETWKPRYFDDWNKAVRQRKVHDYLYIYVNERGELRTQYYPGHMNKVMHHERKDILIDETMSCMGPAFFMHQGRFWELGGCDEKHEGGWGQQAVEVACKAWLSGGKLMVNKKTWFAHWFRGGQGWPYPISGRQIDHCRAYSKDLWMNDKWPLAKRKFMWMIEKFNPPGWEKTKVETSRVEVPSHDRTVIYYTANKEKPSFEAKITKTLTETIGDIPLISVSQKPINLGENICVGEVGISVFNAWRQLQLGLAKATTKYVCLAESDTLYPKEYFEYKPDRDDALYTPDPCYVVYGTRRFNKRFLRKSQGTEGMIVCNREMLLNKLNAIFKGREAWRVGGRQPNFRDFFGTTKLIKFNVSVPVVNIKTDENMHLMTGYIKGSGTYTIPYWGESHELLRRYI